MDNFFDSSRLNRQVTLLQIDDITIGFAHDSVLTIESLSEINSRRCSLKSSGTLMHDGSELPIYTFNDELTLLDQPTANNRFCIAINHSDNNELFAIMCDAIGQYDIEDGITINVVPALNYNPNSPITGMLRKETKLILLTTAESMRAYINSQELD